MQCRDHYLNYLQPGISKAAWSSEEDAALIAMHRELGNKWSTISRKLTGRPENSVKNRFMSALRRSGMGGGEEEGEAAQAGLLFRYIEEEVRPKLMSGLYPAADAPTEQRSLRKKEAAAAAALPFDELLDVVAGGEEVAVDPEVEKILRAPSESMAWQRPQRSSPPERSPVTPSDSHLAAALGLLFPA